MSTFEIILVCFIAWLGLTITGIFAFYICKTKMQNREFLVQNHRELWTFYYNNMDELEELFNPNAKVRDLTEKERTFATMLTTHVECAFSLRKFDLVITENKEAVNLDIASTYSLPLMRKYWESAKKYRSKSFAKEIDKLIKEKQD